MVAYDPSPPTRDVLEVARRIRGGLGLYAVLGAAVTLAGWWADVPRLTDWTGIGIAMKANAAVAALSAGLALVLLARRRPPITLVRALGAFAALVGAATLSQHLVGWNLGIDTLLAWEPEGQGATVSPGRMGPPASTSFTLLGIGIVLASGPRRRLARAVANCAAVVVLGIALLSLLGYLLRVDRLFAASRLTGISLQMASMILALGLGLDAAVPEAGLTRVLLSPSPGGMLARRLLPVVLGVPIAVALVVLTLVRRGWADGPFAIATFTLAVLIASVAIVLWGARLIDQAERLRVANERLVGERERLEHASRQKSAFLANMSHELRTPLNTVIGFSELLHDGRAAGAPSAEQREFLREVMSAGRHLLEVIDDILDLARVEAGKMRLRDVPFAVDELVREVCDSLAPVAAQKRIRVRVEADEPLEVVGDRSRVRQIVANYLSNALKFTPEGGHVVVRVQPEGDAEYRLEVQDDGIGIAPADQRRLFSEFEQLDQGFSKRYPGTGLGLALTRRIAEVMGGRVGVESAPGRGSTFVAVLPRAPGLALDGRPSGADPAPEAAPAPAPSPPPPPAPAPAPPPTPTLQSEDAPT